MKILYECKSLDELLFFTDVFI